MFERACTPRFSQRKARTEKKCDNPVMRDLNSIGVVSSVSSLVSKYYFCVLPKLCLFAGDNLRR